MAAAFGAWFTAHVALHRFFREKEWERKTQAYTAIFEALHDMRLWFDTHWDAEMAGREIPMEKQTQLVVDFQKARGDLKRRLTGETWLIPSGCNRLLLAMMHSLDKEHKSFFDDLDEGSAAMNKAIHDLRRMVRADLQLDRKPWWSRYRRDGT